MNIVIDKKMYIDCNFLLEKSLYWYLQDNHNEFFGEGVEIETKVTPNSTCELPFN